MYLKFSERKYIFTGLEILEKRFKINLEKSENDWKVQL